MKRLILLVLVLFATNAYAQQTSDLMGVGMPAAQADLIGQDAATVAAAGNSQATATDLDDNSAEIAYVTASDGTKAVQLPPKGLGQCVKIVNTVLTAALPVYPGTSETINAIAANGAYTIPAGGSSEFCKVSGTAWYTVGAQLSAPSGTSDTGFSCLAGGTTAAVGDGAFVCVYGDDHGTKPGEIEINAGDNSGDATSFIANTTTVGKIDSAGLKLEDGGTLYLEEATGGSKCMGGSTLNGTTAVTISTTCAKTGARIFISRTGDGSGAAGNDQVGAWATNIVNGVSFDIDASDANDNATVNWIIFNETP